MKKSYLYGATAIGLMLAGCSSNDIINNEDVILEQDQDYFVSMRISGDNGYTRAALADGTPVDTDFTNGTGTESDITSAYFVFYDNQGNVIGDVVPIELDNTKWKNDVTTGTIEKYYKSVIKVSVMKGEKQPTQVICYLNPVNSGNLNKPLSEIQTLQLDQAFKDGGDGNLIFPMSNSVYYKNGDGYPLSIAVPLEMDVNLFTKESLAEDANEKGNCANIYVERYASKLSFDATEASQTDFVTGQRVWDNTTGAENPIRNKITLHFEPQFWAVNAEAKQTYVIKSFREQATDGALLPNNYTYTALNDTINKGITENDDKWSWNAPGFHRSYWGMSPAYFTNVYPEVSDDLDPNHTELQKYISYNDLLNNKKGFAANVTEPKYFKETTVGSLALASKNPAAAVASVIYVGKYTVALNDGTPLANTGFYTYLTGPVPGATNTSDDQPYVYFENNTSSVTSKVEGGESMLKRFFVQCNILYRRIGDTNNYEPYTLGNGTGFNTLAQYLSVSKLSDAELAAYDGSSETKLKLQHNARTLRFNRVPTGQNIYVLTYNGYKQVVETVTDATTQMTLTAANIALARNVGYALYYTSGHAYFNIPVKHFGWYREGNPNKDENVINWNEVRVGDFGMVRNHSYSIKVNKIEGLASGIGGDDVELVPPSFSQNYYMSYNVNILKWAIVPTEGVNL